MLKRYVSVLTGWIFIALGVEHLERLNDAAASVARANDGIDITAFSRNVRIRKALTKLLDLFRAQLCQSLFSLGAAAIAISNSSTWWAA